MRGIGRKRKTINNRFIHAPTLSDGIELKMPARRSRTYERLKSTPVAEVNEEGGKRTQARLLSKPLQPDSSSMIFMTVKLSPKSIDIDFEMKLGGLRSSEFDSG